MAREVHEAALAGHPLLQLLVRTPVHAAFEFHCPRAQRHLRRSGGEYPEDRTAEAFLAAAGEKLARMAAALQEEEEDTVRAKAGGGSAGSRERWARRERANSRRADSLSDLLGSSYASTSGASDSESEQAQSEEEEESQPRGRRRAPAAAPKQRGKQQKGRTAKAAGGRGQGVGPPARLTALTRDGRPRFYHSLTCAAMTEGELHGGPDSDDESDRSDWEVGAVG